MKILLLQDIRGVGKKGEAKDVKEGYAVNFLIPNKLAGVFTQHSVDTYIKTTKIHDLKKTRKERDIRAQLRKISGKVLSIKVTANEQGHLYRAIAQSDIRAALGTMGSILDSGVSIIIDVPIKTVGHHQIALSHKGMLEHITINVE